MGLKLKWRIFPKVADCLVCAFNVIVKFSLFNSECPHTNPAIAKPRIYLGKSATFSIIVSLLVASVSWADNLYQWINNEKENDILCMFRFFQQTWTISIVLSLSLNRHKYLIFYNGILKLFAHRKRYGIATLFTVKDIEKFQYTSFYIFLVSTFSTLYILIINILKADYNIMNLIHACAYFVNVFSGTISTLHTIIWLKVYQSLFMKMHIEMKRVCEERRKNLSLDLADRLRLYNSFYTACVINYENQTLVFTTIPYDVIHFIYVIVALGFSVLYLSFLLIHQDMEVKNGVIGGVLQSAFMCLTSYYMTERSTYIQNTSDNLISYLLKYPITKLNPNEANVVEDLINDLIYYKPILFPGHIFIIHKKLVPTMISHVITYSLMAVQFNVQQYFY
ncbi:hypothetical protein ABEB36_001618 [Hypothenemus hampei]|uniref:Gustatory receptor n=1 Tax=Hypothenemus hampei TaxID=57062 RepID=A0ABD1FF58_HYPHA